MVAPGGKACLCCWMVRRQGGPTSCGRPSSFCPTQAQTPSRSRVWQVRCTTVRRVMGADGVRWGRQELGGVRWANAFQPVAQQRRRGPFKGGIFSRLESRVMTIYNPESRILNGAAHCDSHRSFLDLFLRESRPKFFCPYVLITLVIAWPEWSFVYLFN